jgi:CBS domain-containing protein
MTAGVATEDVDKYLDIVRERTQSRQTGANWIVKSIAAMDNSTSKDTRHRKLTSAMLANQKSGQPVHHWSISREAASDEWGDSYRTIGQFMSTDLFTVKPGDLIDLAASVMDWRHIRHVPVEDEEGRLIGLVTHRGLLRILNLGNRVSRDSIPITVREVMIENPVTVSPSTSSLEAIQLMRSNRVGCLPVVENDQLVGIVTSYDFLEASARLFQQHLGATDDKKESRSRAQGV